LHESDGEYLLSFDLPGATVESLSVQIIGRELELRAQRPAPSEGSDAVMTSFERRVKLPAEVDANSAVAKLDGGVLEIRIAKAPSARRVKIPIGTN
jgi:HSP20 family molecular chaperone IbpA